MNYRYFGNTGIKISEICLGTMGFRWETDKKNSHDILSAYCDSGGIFIDTADIYNEGESERIIGSWLKDKKLRLEDKVYLKICI